PPLWGRTAFLRTAVRFPVAKIATIRARATPSLPGFVVSCPSIRDRPPCTFRPGGLRPLFAGLPPVASTAVAPCGACHAGSAPRTDHPDVLAPERSVRGLQQSTVRRRLAVWRGYRLRSVPRSAP